MKKNRKLRLHRETLQTLTNKDFHQARLDQVQGAGCPETNDRTCLVDTCGCTPYCPWSVGCG